MALHAPTNLPLSENFPNTFCNCGKSHEQIKFFSKLYQTRL